MSAKKNKSRNLSGRAKGYIWITIIFLALLLFYPGNNLLTWIKSAAQIRMQEKQIRRYQVEIMEMNSRIQELTTEKDTLEKFARENFHFAEPGEDVYITK